MDGKYIGEIVLFAGTYTPEGWMDCDGRLLEAQQHQALYSIIGNTYGGDVRRFALPDLRGRVPVCIGAGPGLNPVSLGKKDGAEAAVITVDQLPVHKHDLKVVGKVSLSVSKEVGDTNDPTQGNPAAVSVDVADPGGGGSLPSTIMAYKKGPSTDKREVALESTGANIEPAGSGKPVSLRNPYLGVRYCIVVDGEYPPQQQ
ncbi:MAG: tail fiber protein [Prosthecobacter sp.]|jgi:microcystin-dependent protein|uniref:phage tail protein n=1 Tax=Prosthecobacter sp. TaxID=1965333 RepID=UPI0019FBF9FF|nr:tail fiber protein [Prosthecobacter sp.]MBE2286956.1 tail fiber protein [Prosthecobacter sp.]